MTTILTGDCREVLKTLPWVATTGPCLESKRLLGIRLSAGKSGCARSVAGPGGGRWCEGRRQMKHVCICCGALFVDGKGWVEPHYFPCANHNYGWAWCVTVADDWERPPDMPLEEQLRETNLTRKQHLAMS